MQKDREVASDLAIVSRTSSSRVPPDHHPVALVDGMPKQVVPNGAANQIDLHE